MVNEDGHFFVPEMDGSGSMFGLLEVPYGDLVIDLGGVLHDGWISRHRILCIPLWCAFRNFDSPRDVDYKIAAGVSHSPSTFVSPNNVLSR